MTLPDYAWLKERVIDSDEGREQIKKADGIAAIAREIDCTPAQLAIAWCLRHPNVSTVILGASRPEQLRENLKALDKTELLTDEVLERIEGVLQNKPEPPVEF